MSEGTLESRDKIMEFCESKKVRVMNTAFLKPPELLLTYKEMSTEGFKAPWTPSRYAQIDHVLVPNQWKNVITDVQSNHTNGIDSDHSLITVTYHTQLAGIHKAEHRKPKRRYRTPTEEEPLHLTTG